MSLSNKDKARWLQICALAQSMIVQTENLKTASDAAHAKKEAMSVELKGAGATDADLATI